MILSEKKPENLGRKHLDTHDAHETKEVQNTESQRSLCTPTCDIKFKTWSKLKKQ